MAERKGAIQISRPVQLRPFTSATTEEFSTKTPTFEFVVPRDAGFIDLDLATWPSARFVYVFVQASNETPAEASGVSQAAGPAANASRLAWIVKVLSSGAQSVCVGIAYKAAMGNGGPPPFVDMSSGFETVVIEPEALKKSAANHYAIAAPILLPLSAIDSLEKNRPSSLPVFGTGMGVGASGKASSANPDWVFPIVDPILIAENLTRKYFEAADNFLATSQEVDRPLARDEAEQSARRAGELDRLKKTIADNLLALKSAAPQLADAFDDNLKAAGTEGSLENFLEGYTQRLEDRRNAREEAAFHLISWLEGELFKLADSFWERKQGKPNADYELYLKAVLDGMSRLIESDRGVEYLMDVRNRFEAGSSPVPNGVLHVSTEFLFRDTNTTDEQFALASKTSISVFGAWSGLLSAGLSVRMRVLKGPNPTTDFVQDLQLFVSRLRFVFRDAVLTIQVTDIQLTLLRAPRGVKTSILPVKAAELSGVKKALDKVNLPTPHITRVLTVLNFGIAFTALRSAMQENNDPRAVNMAIADLAGAALGGIDQAIALAAVTRFRDRISGKLNMGGEVLGFRASAVLGLLASVASLVSASLATADSYDKGDWDQALSHLTEGVGAIITGAGATIILVSGATGPFALWTIGIGTVVSTAGFIWSVFAADTEVDQMLKFCAFGQQAGQAALKPPGWSLCQTSFAEWNKNTPDGLLRQLKAFQQLFYSFSVSGDASVGSGPLASDGFLRITPATLRQACSFIIDYKAEYSQFGSSGVVRTLTGRATLIVPATVNPVLVDAANNYDLVGAVRVHKDTGKDAMDIRFRLRAGLAPTSGPPLELGNLTCSVFLQLPNARADDSSAPLIVPTTAAGPKAVTALVVSNLQADSTEQPSVKVK